MLEHLVKEFGQTKAREVYSKIESVLDQYQECQRCFLHHLKKSFRKCVLSKQTSVYYQIKNEYIEVVSFRTNRKDPDGFKV